MSRIEWVIANCRLLAAIGDELEQSRPFAGLTIGTGIHLEPEDGRTALDAAAGRCRARLDWAPNQAKHA